MMGLTAISLDPSDVEYRVNVANVLMELQQPDRAVQVLQNAAKLAKTPEELMRTNTALLRAQAYTAAQDRITEENRRSTDGSGASTRVPHLVRRDSAANGPHHFVTGVLQNVHCDLQNMDLAVKTSGETVPLHSDNYYQIQFTSLGFQPDGDLKPCNDLEGKPAKVEYVEPANKSDSTHLVSIELHK